MDVTVALLSLTVVPFLYLCIRYYISTLMNREERVKELESKLVERLYETFSRDAARQELRARAARDGSGTRAPATTTMRSAHRASPGSSRSSRVVVSAITILGTALVLVVGGVHVHARADVDRRLDRGHRVPRRGLRAAVGDRAHDRPTAGRDRRRQARARDVRT